ncbi:PIN domain-containing protein [Methanospirillum stamsii]|uniref:type II toxin-antitoxin system VapC family toxin n=1 Tax=Methanospirillum stamsii TaxID=1277351 RepID=UPI0011B1E639|nr:PIN domain-containing protein [Methanospirillum stamsii]
METHRNGDTDRVTILIDTNAFLMTSQFKIDLFEEIRFLLGSVRMAVPEIVIRELEGLAKGKGNNASAARLGLQFAKGCEVIPSSGDGTPDEQIFNSAKDLRCGVVTNDRRLRDLILKEGLPVVSLSGKQKLELIRR